MVMLPPMRWLLVTPSYGAWEQDNLHNWDLTRPLHYMALSFSGVGFGWASSTTFTT